MRLRPCAPRACWATPHTAPRRATTLQVHPPSAADSSRQRQTHMQRTSCMLADATKGPDPSVHSIIAAVSGCSPPLGSISLEARRSGKSRLRSLPSLQTAGKESRNRSVVAMNGAWKSCRQAAPGRHGARHQSARRPPPAPTAAGQVPAAPRASGTRSGAQRGAASAPTHALPRVCASKPSGFMAGTSQRCMEVTMRLARASV